MTDVELHMASLWEAISDRAPDRTALVQGARRRSWRELDERAASFAGALVAAGLGPGARVGQMLYNSIEFVETHHGALKIRGIPFNINFRYTADEVAYLLDDADADALVFHSSLSHVVARATASNRRLKLLVEVDDGGTNLVGATPYETALAGATAAPRITRHADDPAMLYTGGTTGMPKGVITRVGVQLSRLLEGIPPLLGRPPVAVGDVPDLVAELEAAGELMVSLPACPLVHSTAKALGMAAALVMGGTVVLLEGRTFDACELWDLVVAEHVNTITIVGDAFARPMLAELDANPGRDLRAVRTINSSGAMFSVETKTGLLQHLPQATIIDIIGATEGTMGMSISMAGAVAETGRFRPSKGVIVVDDRGQEIEPGSEQPGLIALPGGGEGYHKDAAKSAVTFREIDGRRYTIPGDYARRESDGTVTLLGRGSSCINTAGEKVYPEEVEEIIKAQPGIDDCLVFGVPDDRFGQRVAGIVSYTADGGPSLEQIVAAARQHLAAYKLPRSLVVVDQVPRNQIGKADYASARALFDAAAAPGAG